MLVADQLTFKVGEKTLVEDISFTLSPGELLIILGANGAGKSTLFHMLSGDKTPSKGTVTLDNKNLRTYSIQELALKRAVVNQQNTMNMAFTVKEIVLMGRYPHFEHSSSQRDAQIANKMMHLTGITHLSQRSYLSLSGGEQQRVQLSRVLAQIWDIENAVLLMDEPVSNLDILYQQQTLAIAKKLAERGVMVLAILHDINLTSQYADRIIMLKGGRKYYEGSPADVLLSDNIDDIFNIQADIFTNPVTNKCFLLPKDVTIELG
jgi:iron complex transport system ATP-binding protein